MKPRWSLSILSLVLLAVAARGEIVEKVIVKVNGDIVTQSEFEARQIAAVQQSRVGTDQVEKFLRENNAHILQEAIDDLLLVQRAADLGMKMRPDYIKEVIEGIKKENNIASDEDLQQQLRREGMSLDELKRNIERNILKRQVLQRELESKVTATEDDGKAYYQGHMDEYTKAATVRLQQIVVKADPKEPNRAEEIVARIRNGEDFAELAKTYSVGPNTASGGDLGTLRKGDLAPDVEKVAFSLGLGQVSDPIPTADGYRILRVMEKTEGSVTPYEDARIEILRRLNAARSSEEVERYLQGLRDKAIIDLRVREVGLQLNQPVTQGTSLLDSANQPPEPGGPPAATAPAAPGPAAPAAPADPDAEISTSPQTAPERVAPDEPAAPKPSPSPTPQPPPE
jgi:peptidyl-prolyl cis-trans isomerase SurA